MERGTPDEAVFFRQHGQDVHWVEEPAVKFPPPRRHDRKVNVATLEPDRQSGAAFFNEMDLDVGVTPAVSHEKIRKQVLDHLRRSAYPKDSRRLPSFERARPLGDRLNLCQHTPATPQQIFALRRQLDAATAALEERHAQRGRQRAYLS